MKHIVITILWIMFATPALACVNIDDVEFKEVDSFPVLGYTAYSESRDEVTFVIYLRDIGNFEGLSSAGSEIKDAQGADLYRASLSLKQIPDNGLFQTSFVVNKELLEKSTLVIEARKTDRGEHKTEDGRSFKSIHSTIYMFRFNLKMLYMKYGENDFNRHSQNEYHDEKVEAFLKKVFKQDRDKAKPSNKME